MKRTIRVRKHRRKGKIVRAHIRKIKRNYGMGLISGKKVRPQLHVGAEKIQPPFRSIGTNVKPGNVLWTSTYTPKGEYKSDWDRFIKQGMESRDSEDSVILKPEKDAKIFRINTLKDLENLYEKYPGETFYGKPGVDWGKASEDLDAVQLTDYGQRETRMPSVYKLTKKKPKYPDLDLYGWDVESTAWFKPKFFKINKG